MNIRILCLGILQFGDATGYEINKLSSDGCFSHFIEASYGSIYPALTKLTSDGLVTWREEEQTGRPARKVYSLTEAGRTELVSALHNLPRGDVFKSEFLFMCLYSDMLPADHLRSVIEFRMQELQEELVRLDEAGRETGHAGSRFAIGYGKALTEAAIAYIAANKSMLQETQETLAVAEAAPIIHHGADVTEAKIADRQGETRNA